jgi:hypothetical protein
MIIVELAAGGSVGRKNWLGWYYLSCSAKRKWLCSKNRAFVQGRELGKKWRNGSHIFGTTNSISTAAEYGRMMNKATFQSKWKDPCWPRMSYWNLLFGQFLSQTDDFYRKLAIFDKTIGKHLRILTKNKILKTHQNLNTRPFMYKLIWNMGVIIKKYGVSVYFCCKLAIYGKTVG